MLRRLFLELSLVVMRCSSNIDEVVVLQETGRHSLEPLQRRQRRIQKQCYQICTQSYPSADGSLNRFLPLTYHSHIHNLNQAYMSSHTNLSYMSASATCTPRLTSLISSSVGFDDRKISSTRGPGVSGRVTSYSVSSCFRMWPMETGRERWSACSYRNVNKALTAAGSPHRSAASSMSQTEKMSRYLAEAYLGYDR